MDTRRNISFAIMMASLDLFSLMVQQRAASRFLKHRITRLVPMPSVNAFWRVFGERAWIHILILSEKQLHRVLSAYVEYFNRARPHQDIHQQVPEREVTCVPSAQPNERIISVPVLGGLHYEYR
jgi:hypothetical protein